MKTLNKLACIGLSLFGLSGVLGGCGEKTSDFFYEYEGKLNGNYVKSEVTNDSLYVTKINTNEILKKYFDYKKNECLDSVKIIGKNWEIYITHNMFGYGGMIIIDNKTNRMFHEENKKLLKKLFEGENEDYKNLVNEIKTKNEKMIQELVIN